MSEIQIRPLTRLDEMRGAVELQKSFWGNDLEATVPAHMLFSLATHGGHILAAFDGQKMVGVLIDFLGTDPGEPDRPALANLQLVSKRMVVLPEYQGQEIGYHLKREQRRLAIKQGIRLITWTFDPLLSLNAHLNIRKLGAISDTYVENYYGTTEGGNLTTLGTSDRLLADWWVTSRRVDERVNGGRRGLGLQHYLDADTRIANATHVDSTGYALPPGDILLPTSSLILLEIPVNYGAIVRDNPTLAQIWRSHIRALFQHLLGMQYIVTDFVRETFEGRSRGFYLLSQNNKPFEALDFSRN